MDMIDYLQMLMQWDVDADQKFVIVPRDGVLMKISLRGHPQSIEDPNIDFDSIEIPKESLGSFQVNRKYYLKNGQLY